MPGSTPATSQLDWLSSTTAMIVLSWSKAARDLLKSFSWGIRALRQLFASDDGAISSPPAPYHLSAGGRWIRTSGSALAATPPHRPRRPLSFVRFLSCLRARDLWSEAARAVRTSAPRHIGVYDILRFDREGHPKSRWERTTRGRTTHENRQR